MEGRLICEDCGVEISLDESVKYGSLCPECAKWESNGRIVEEALAYGYGYEE